MQKAFDTAIDQGGPSMQFLSDAWKQMQCLAVPVLSSKVEIFEQATAGKKRHNVLELIPIQDDYLIYKIHQIAAGAGITVSDEVKKLVESTKTRIYCYARVMGRFLVGMCAAFLSCRIFVLTQISSLWTKLHSFARGYPVSSAVLTPFYMNCKRIIYLSIVKWFTCTKQLLLFTHSATSWNHIRRSML